MSNLGWWCSCSIWGAVFGLQINLLQNYSHHVDLFLADLWNSHINFLDCDESSLRCAIIGCGRTATCWLNECFNKLTRRLNHATIFWNWINELDNFDFCKQQQGWIYYRFLFHFTIGFCSGLLSDFAFKISAYFFQKITHFNKRNHNFCLIRKFHFWNRAQFFVHLTFGF